MKEGRKGRREKGGKRKMNDVGYLGDQMAKWMGQVDGRVDCWMTVGCMFVVE